MKLSDEAVSAIRKYATFNPAGIVADPEQSYNNGLKDGAVELAKYVLEGLTEEENA